MEAQTKEELEEIKQQIIKARKWARNHFNSGNVNQAPFDKETLELSKPACFVEFPDIDTMKVCPSFMGQKVLNGALSFEYRLSFNPLGWQGKHPIWDHDLPLLKVE